VLYLLSYPGVVHQVYAAFRAVARRTFRPVRDGHAELRQ
jgi:hypothetical protein